MKTKILIIYTGGTIGMVADPDSGALVPLNFQELTKQVPELKRFNFDWDAYEFAKPIDSSNVNPNFWIELVEVIEKFYHQYHGFVILHGTDTMAHTACALSYMIQNVDKPIILTGSQLPIGTIRTDGKENLITAMEIAADQKNGKSVVNEVCVCFENQLFRGNRVSKVNAEYFNAFSSENYPLLADIGIGIHYHDNHFLEKTYKPIAFYKKIENNVAVLKIFPGMSPEYVESIIGAKNLKALIIETYGAGNAPTDDWFIDALESASKKGIVIINVTQCKAGFVNQGHYETSIRLLKMGIISAEDMTFEAAITKTMFLLGLGFETNTFVHEFMQPISGEMSLQKHK
jgi:L-asparaginase